MGKLRGMLRAWRRLETSKKILWACLLNGFAWVWCSYLLAALDKPQIAETLSAAAVAEIVGAALAYSVKSMLENLSKHNRWPDRPEPPPQPELQEEDTDHDRAGIEDQSGQHRP